jgi:hypothetical protein
MSTAALLAVAEELEEAFDKDIYPEQVKEDFDAPDDREYSVTISAKQWRALSRAITEAKKPAAIPCSERMPTPREYVLMWETPSLRWSVGDWMPEYQQWSNRDDREYAIHPHQVSHWMPLPEPIR